MYTVFRITFYTTQHLKFKGFLHKQHLKVNVDFFPTLEPVYFFMPHSLCLNRLTACEFDRYKKITQLIYEQKPALFLKKVCIMKLVLVGKFVIFTQLS